MNVENESDVQERPAHRVSQVLVVLNPSAGNSNPERIQKAFRKHFDNFRIHELGGEANTGKAISEALAEGFDVIVAAGGDGTVASVASKLVGKGVPMGILPAGTGNMLARGLRIPTDLDRAVALLAGEHEIKQVDGMQIGDDVFMLNVGVGVSSVTMRDTETKDKRRFGMFAYAWTGLTRWLGFKPRYFSLVTDDRRDRVRASEVFVANGSLPVLPRVPTDVDIRLDDGELDVFIVRSKTARDYLRLLWDVFLRGKNRSSQVFHRSANHYIRISSDRPLPVQADGEVIGHTPVEVRVLRAAVQVVVPPAVNDDGNRK